MQYQRTAGAPYVDFMAANAATRPRTATPAEAAARTCLEERAGRAFSDQEWKVMRDRLCAYVRLLRSWEDRELNSSRVLNPPL
jgi:hypothetical protein